MTPSATLTMPRALAALLLALALAVCAPALAAAQSVLYVDDDAAGMGTGDSFVNAYPDLQTALANASASGDAIVVAAGTYAPGTATTDSYFIDGTLDGLAIYGGWAGTESFASVADVEAALATRDLTTNATVFTGALGDPADPADNLTALFRFRGDSTPFTTAPVLDGVELREAARSAVVMSDAGGRFARLRFVDNARGLEVQDGAAGTSPAEALTFEDVTFEGNVGSGAVLLRAFSDGEVRALFRRATFVDNRAVGSFASGGAVEIASAQTTSSISADFVDAVFENNVADGNEGGAVRISSADVTFTNTRFAGNASGGTGTAIRQASFNGSSRLAITNSVFTGHPAGQNTPSFMIWSNSGGDLLDMEITNTTFAHNGDPALYFGAGFGDELTATIDNSIFWKNGGGSPTSTDTQIEAQGAGANVFDVAIRRSLIEGGLAGGVDGPISDDGNTLDDDPLFADANGPDDTFGTRDDDVSLQRTSPAIDVGDNALLPADAFDLDGDGDTSELLPLDLAGRARVVDNGNPTVDLGALELPLPPPIFVDANAMGAGTGTSFDDAFTNLWLTLATEVGPDDVVVVAAGTYTPDRSRRDNTFALAAEGLEVYGGWSGTETFVTTDEVRAALGTRDFRANPTILSGDIGVANDPSDNVFHVVSIDGSVVRTVLDGFTVTGGTANGTGTDSRGGGVYSQACAPTFANLTVTGNTASFEGGGMYLFPLTSQCGTTVRPAFRDVRVEANTSAQEGGGVFLTSAAAQRFTASFERVGFIDNTTTQLGGDGAGLYLTASEGDVIFADATFRGNRAEEQGGGVYVRSTVRPVALDVTDTRFLGNDADRGGGLYLEALGGTLAARVNNVTFEGNQATDSGGGYEQFAAGGNVEGELTNVTFSNNATTFTNEGRALRLRQTSGASTLALANSIVWDADASAQPRISLDGVSTLTLGANLVKGGEAQIDAGTDGTVVSGTTLDADPAFADADGGDATPGTRDDDARLTSASPALDAGRLAALDPDADGTRDLTTDLDGNPRVFGGTVDLGAYEFSSFVSTSATPTVGGQTGFFGLGGTGATVLFTENAATSGGLAATLTATPPAGSGLPDDVAGFFVTIDASPAFDGPFTYNLTLDASTLPVINDFSALTLYVSDDGGATWTNLADDPTLRIVRNEPDETVTVFGRTSFSSFVLGGPAGVLPVELAQLTATTTDDGAAVRLAWQTASETNNAGFAVERAAGEDGDAWTEVGFVEGAGTTSEARAYRFTDAAVPFGAEGVRYRLRQVDFDGTATVAGAVEVTLGPPTETRLHAAFPNPLRAGEAATLRYAVAEPGTVELAVFDVLGRRVATLAQGEAAAGRQTVRFAARGLASGVYFVRLATPSGVQTTRLTVVR